MTRKRRAHARPHPSVDVSVILSARHLARAQVPQVFDPEALESPKNRRMRRRRLPDPRPIPEGVREPICIRKK